jgi:hypothetical protein
VLEQRNKGGKRLSFRDWDGCDLCKNCGWVPLCFRAKDTLGIRGTINCASFELCKEEEKGKEIKDACEALSKIGMNVGDVLNSVFGPEAGEIFNRLKEEM